MLWWILWLIVYRAHPCSVTRNRFCAQVSLLDGSSGVHCICWTLKEFEFLNKDIMLLANQSGFTLFYSKHFNVIFEAWEFAGVWFRSCAHRAIWTEIRVLPDVCEMHIAHLACCWFWEYTTCAWAIPGTKWMAVITSRTFSFISEHTIHEF